MSFETGKDAEAASTAYAIALGVSFQRTLNLINLFLPRRNITFPLFIEMWAESWAWGLQRRNKSDIILEKYNVLQTIQNGYDFRILYL